jgi:fibronectin-binding autotransporter adhesin
VISGAGSLTKTGTGALVLSGSNTYTGSTTVTNGTLRLGSNNALPTGRPLVVNATTAGGNATVDLDGYNLSISSLTLGGSSARANATNSVSTGTGMLTLGGDISYVWATSPANDPGAAFITGNLNLGSGGRVISVLDSTRTTTELTISANISGAGTGLTKTDAGTLVLSGTNTYTGSTIVSGGVLRVGSASNLPSTTNLQLNGGVLELAGDIALTAGTGAGQMRWTGSGGFSAFGGDRTVNYNGGSDVTWGTNFVTNTAPLILSSAASDSKVTFGNNINLGAATRTVVVNNGSADVDAALSGVLSNGSLTVTGSGALLLSGLSTYTGVTTINGNATAVVTTLANGGVNSSLGVSGTAATNLVINNATLRYTGTGGSTNRLFQIGTTANGAEAILDASGVASDTNDGSIVFSNTGVLGFGTTNRTRLLTLTGTNTGNNTLSARITNNGSSVTVLTKDGAGKWVLTGANSYSGDTYVDAGILSIRNSSSLGTVANNVTTVESGATLDLDNVAVGNEVIILNGTGAGGIGALTSSGTSSHSGQMFLFSDVRVGVSGSLLLTGTVGNSQFAYTMTKVGSGTLTLGGTADNYGLGVTVDAGKVILAKASGNNNYALDQVLTINNGGIAQLAGSGNDQLYGAADVVVNEGGTFDLNGRSESFDGLSGFGIVTNTAAATTSTIAAGEAGANSAFGGTLQDGSGVLAFEKIGGGILTLSGSNSYTGGTTISEGILEIGNGGTTGSIAGDIVNNAELIVNRSGSLVLDGAISGSGWIVKLGSGTLTLSGSNSYEGVTSVTQGTLVISNNSGLGSAEGTGVEDGGTLHLDNVDIGDEVLWLIGSGTGVGGQGALTVTGTSSTGGIVSFDHATVGIADDSTLTLRGSVGTGLMTKIGQGTLVLTGTTDNPGLNLLFTAGQLILAKDSSSDVHAIGDGLTIGTGASVQVAGTGGDQIFNGAVVQVDGGGTLDLNGRSDVIDALTGSGTVTNTAAATTSTFAVGDWSTDCTFDGTLQDGAGTLALVKNGEGNFTLTGSNTYTGGTTISGGTLQIGDGGATGSISGDITNNSRLVVNRSGSLVLGGAISGVGAITKLSSGTLTLSGSNSYEGNTDIAEGTLAVTNDFGLGIGSAENWTNVSDGATLQLDNVNIGNEWLIVNGSGVGGNGGLTVTGTSSSSGQVNFSNATVNVASDGALTLTGPVFDVFVKEGAGTFTLGGTADNSGLIGTVNAGLLVLTKDSAPDVHAIGYGVTIGNSGTVRIGGTGGDQIYNEAIVDIHDGGMLDLNGRTERIAGLTGSGIVTNTAAATTATFEVGDWGADSTFDGTLQDGAGTLALAKTGSGNFTLTGANTFTGGTTLWEGVLTLGSAGAIGNQGAITFRGGTLQFSEANTTDYSGRFSTEAGQAFKFDTNSQDVTFSENISSENGSFEKHGAGTLTLTGTNSYEGTTLINDGVLLILGDNSATGETIVDDGGTLGGTGRIGDVRVLSGGILSPGSSPGLLTIDGNLTMEEGSTLLMEFSGTGTGLFDQIAVEDSFTAGGILNLQLIDGFNPIEGDSFLLFTSGGFDAGGFSSIVTNLGDGLYWDISLLGSTGMVTVVPEPSVAALATLGLGTLLLRAINHRRRPAS